MEGVEPGEDMHFLHCFVSRRIGHVGYYFPVIHSDSLGFGLVHSLLFGLEVISFGSSFTVGLMLLGSIVQSSLVFLGQCMLQRGELGV